MTRPRTIDDHIKLRQLELAAGIEGRRKVYLDLRFWIIARDVAEGVDTSPGARKLLHLLRRGVARGALLCPTSESVVMEVMKQANTRTRRQATARLVDELSLGVALMHGRRRVNTEIAYLLHRFGSEAVLHPQRSLVWTKVAHALGEQVPQAEGLEPELRLELQKGVFDALWAKGLTDMFEAIGDAEHPDRDLQGAAEVVAAGIREHAPGLVSYEQTYRDEVRGAVDVYGSAAVEVIGAMAEATGVRPAAPGSPEWDACLSASRNLLAEAVGKPEGRNILRTLHALASLHAGLRWDRSTRFTVNHLYDFDHAAGAVAYCDAFLTEGFLAHIANARHIRLPELNGCAVTADLDEAIAILRTFQ